VLRWLNRKVDVGTMRGGILQVETKLRDPEMARKIVGAYGDAIREQQGLASRSQIRDKQKVLTDLVQEASEGLRKAQGAYDEFRLRTRYSQPAAAITAIGDRIPALEQAVKAKQVELKAIRQFATDENMRVRQVVAEIAALNDQLSEARSVSPDEQNSVGRVVLQSTEADSLRRDLQVQQTLFDSYNRLLQSASAESLTSTVNMRILEPAYVDPARQYNRIPLVIGIMILLLGLAIEFYSLRPPLQERKLA
jgi:tyrosine-protein kinase Etk/Wzc